MTDERENAGASAGLELTTTQLDKATGVPN